MSKITLYGSMRSGHSYKPRLYMILAGIAHRYQPIDIMVPRGERPREFQRVSQFGEVPVLVDGDQVITQSNAILLHLARKFALFGAADAKGWDEITTWLFWEANRIGRSFPNLRWYRLADTSGDPGLVRWFHETAEVDLDRLNQELSSKPFILNGFSIADIACAGYLLYGSDPRIGLDFARWPAVEAWLDRIRALPNFEPPQSVMERPNV